MLTCAHPFRAAVVLALCALPFSGITATASVPMPTMALDGHLLVESVLRYDAENERRMVRSPDNVRSGDRLIFLIRYRNRGAGPLPGYDFVAPIPAGVKILPDKFGMVRISADGGRNWMRPDAPFAVDARGKLLPLEGLQPTHVRFRLDRRIAPGEAGTVAYRGMLL